MTTPLTMLPGIHFLVHPVFNAAPGPFEHVVTEREFIARGRPDGFIYVDQEAIEEDLKIYPSLIAGYSEKARIIPEDEILAVFLSFRPNALDAGDFFDPRFEPLVTGLLSEIQAIMGARLLLFWKDHDPALFPAVGRAVGNALSLKGYGTGPATQSHAFGETLEECIPRSVRHLRRALGLRKLTQVDPLFTDLRPTWDQLDASEKANWTRQLKPNGIVLDSKF